MAEYLDPSLIPSVTILGGSTPSHDVPPNPAKPTAARDAATKKQQQHRHRLAWLLPVLKAPLRALRSLCNYYERGMTRCAESHAAAMVGGLSMGAYPAMPRSYSCRTQSSDDDLRELMRAASQGILVTRVMPAAVGPDGVQRSQSAVVWRIDEDKEVDFADGSTFTVGKVAGFPRSRSYAVGRVPRVPAVTGTQGAHYQRRLEVAVADAGRDYPTTKSVTHLWN